MWRGLAQVGPYPHLSLDTGRWATHVFFKERLPGVSFGFNSDKNLNDHAGDSTSRVTKSEFN